VSVAAQNKSDATAKIVLALIGLGFVLVLSMAGLDPALRGENDFVPMYMGGKLAGTPELWRTEPYFSFMQQRFGAYNDALTFIRPPFYALMLWPLAQAPYEAAYAVWTLLRVAALAGFVWLWRIPSRVDAFLFLAVSLPAAAGLLGGQDTAFILFLTTAAIALERNGKPVLAGLALSLCAIKFNLLLPLPLLLLAQKRWDIVKGFAGGAAVLTALSFAAGGWGWPAQYWDLMLADRIHPNPKIMPNLRGMLHPLGAGPALEWALSAAVLAAAWAGLRRTDFAGGMTLVFMSGLLITPHAYVPDCLLLVPAALIVMHRAGGGLLMAGGMVLLWPPVYLMVLGGSGWHVAMPAALLAYFGLSVWMFVRGSRTSEEPAVEAASEPAVSV